MGKSRKTPQQPPKQPRRIKLEQKKASIAARRDEACRLRVLGTSYEDIARKLGFSDKSSAWHAVQQGLKLQPKPGAKELLLMLTDGSVSIYAAHRPYAEGSALDEDGKPVRPDKGSADVCDRHAARLSALFGLEQPKNLRVELNRETEVLLDKIQKAMPPDVYERILEIVSRDGSEEEAGEASSGPGDEPPDPDQS